MEGKANSPMIWCKSDIILNSSEELQAHQSVATFAEVILWRNNKFSIMSNKISGRVGF